MSHYENLLAVAQRAEKNTGKEFKVSLFKKSGGNSREQVPENSRPIS